MNPLDMRGGMDSILARVVQVFGEARPHHAYLFANRRPVEQAQLFEETVNADLAAMEAELELPDQV